MAAIEPGYLGRKALLGNAACYFWNVDQEKQG